MSLSDMLFSPLRRFYTFVLKKLIGDYLKDELQPDQLDVKLTQGYLELKDLELDVEVLNETVTGLPFEFVSATVASLKAKIPWHSLSTQNCEITLEGLRCTVKPLDDSAPANPMSESFLIEASRKALEEEEMSKLVKQHINPTRIKRANSNGSTGSAGASESNTKGMQVIGDKLKSVLEKTEFFVKDCSVILIHKNSSSRRTSAVIARFSQAAYVNATKADRGEQKFRKEVKLKGLRVEVAEDFEPGEEKYGEFSRSITIAHAEIDQYCIVRLTPPPLVPNGDRVPRKLEFEGDLHALRILVGPQQLRQLGFAIADMSESSRLLMKRLQAMREEEGDENGHVEPATPASAWGISKPKNDLDDLFKQRPDKKDAMRPPFPRPAQPMGKPIKPEEYKTVEGLLSNAAMAESFASAISHATDGTDQFFDCNSGSMLSLAGYDDREKRAASDTIGGATADVSLRGSDAKKDESKSKPDSPSARRKQGWKLVLKMVRLCVILLERDVPAEQWPKDTDWYLSPIPLPNDDYGGDSFSPHSKHPKHPAPGILTLYENHLVAHIDNIATVFDQGVEALRSTVSVRSLGMLEYVNVSPGSPPRASDVNEEIVKCPGGAFRSRRVLSFERERAPLAPLMAKLLPQREPVRLEPLSKLAQCGSVGEEAKKREAKLETKKLEEAKESTEAKDLLVEGLSVDFDGGEDKPKLQPPALVQGVSVTSYRKSADHARLEGEDEDEEDIPDMDDYMADIDLGDGPTSSGDVGNRSPSDESSNFDDLIAVSLGGGPRPRGLRERKEEKTILGGPSREDAELLPSPGLDAKHQGTLESLPLTIPEALPIPPVAPPAARLQDQLKRTERQLNPDLRIVFTQTAKSNHHKSGPAITVEIKARDALIKLDMGALKRLSDLSKATSGASDSGEPLADEGETVAENGASVADGVSVAASARDLCSPTASSSCGEPLEVDLDEFLGERVRMYADEGKHRNTRRPKTQQKARITGFLPRVQIELYPSNEDGSIDRKTRGVFMDCKDLRIANTDNPEDNQGFAEVRDDQDKGQGEPWVFRASRVVAGLGPLERPRNPLPEVTVLRIDRPEIRLSRPKSAAEEAIFHPFLAPGSKISAHETEAFFQRLWDPYRVWEAHYDQDGSGKKKPRGSASRKGSRPAHARRKEAKTLEQFERSCERQSGSHIHIHGESALVTMNQSEYHSVLVFAKRLGSTLADPPAPTRTEQKAPATRRRSPSGESARARASTQDPELLPDHPSHVPAPPRPPSIHVTVSREAYHAAYHHALALCTTVKTLRVNLTQEDQKSARERKGEIPGFALTVDGFRGFHLQGFNQEKTHYTSLTADTIQLCAARFNSRRQLLTHTLTPILMKTMLTGGGMGMSASGNSNKVGRSNRTSRHIVQFVHVMSGQGAERKQLQTAINFNSASLHLSKLSVFESWLVELKNFFTLPPSASPTPSPSPPPAVNNQASFLYIHATDCAVDYNPPQMSRGVLVFDRVSMRMCDVGGPSPSHITFDLSDLRGYVVPEGYRPRHLLQLRRGRRASASLPKYLCGLPGESLIAYLECYGFLRVASIDAFQMSIQLLPKHNEAALHEYILNNPLVPDTMVELTKGRLCVEACSDSLSVLAALSSQIALELTPAQQPQEVEVSLKSKDDLRLAIDHDAFAERKAPLTMKQRAILDAEKAYDRRTLTGTKITDYFDKSGDGNAHPSGTVGLDAKDKKMVDAAVTAQWLHGFKIRDNHFRFKGETDRIYKTKELHPPRWRGVNPRPSLTFKMHSVSFQIRLFGGKDFGCDADEQPDKKEAQIESKRSNSNSTSHDEKDRDSVNTRDVSAVDTSAYSNASERTMAVNLIRDDLRSAASSIMTLPVDEDQKRRQAAFVQEARFQTISIRPSISEEEDKGLHAHVRDSYMQRALESGLDGGIPGLSAAGNPRGSKHGRHGDEKIEMNVTGAHMVFNGYRPESRVASFLAVTLDDIDVIDMVKSSGFRGRNLLGYEPPVGLLRESGSSMVRIKLTNIRPDPERSPDRQEARINVSVLPIRVLLDQDTVEFLGRFLAGVQVKDSKSQVAAEGKGGGSLHLPDEDTQAPPEMYIQSFRIDQCKLCVDYTPKRIDLEALRSGEYAQLAHLLRLEEVRITLDSKELRAVEGWGGLAAKLGKQWADQVIGQQLHRCLAGIQPLRSLIRVGSGVVDLVVLPIEQFRKDGRVMRGLKKGVSGLIKAVTVETINVATSLAIGAQSLLESVDSAITERGNPGKAARARRHGSGGKSRGARSGSVASRVHTTRSSDRQPTDLRDGLQQAYDAFSGGLKDAARQIVVVPADKINAGEFKGAVSSAVTAVPSAVIRSMVGVSEGVSKVLIAAKNTAEPDRNKKFRYQPSAP